MYTFRRTSRCSVPSGHGFFGEQNDAHHKNGGLSRCVLRGVGDAPQVVRDNRGDVTGQNHFPFVEVDFPDNTNVKFGSDNSRTPTRSIRT